MKKVVSLFSAIYLLLMAAVPMGLADRVESAEETEQSEEVETAEQAEEPEQTEESEQAEPAEEAEPAGETEPASEPELPRVVEDNLVTSTHRASIQGKNLNYTATAGTVALTTGGKQCEIFFKSSVNEVEASELQALYPVRNELSEKRIADLSDGLGYRLDCGNSLYLDAVLAFQEVKVLACSSKLKASVEPDVHGLAFLIEPVNHV